MILARTAIEAAIVTIDGYVAAGRSDVVDLRFDRGQLLELLGRPAEAMRDYVAVIAADPLHVNALNALGLAFLGDGHRALARTMLEAAVTHGPQHAAARANLGYVELVDGRVDEASRLYEAALRIDPMLAVAHHGLAQIAEQRGDGAAAAARHARGLQCRPVTISRYTGDTAPINVLRLATAAAGNVVTEHFFDPTVFQVASVIVEHVDSNLQLPPHDVLFNVIGEADLCASTLRTAAAIARRSGAPIVNHPDAVTRTGRVANARRLGRLAGVRAPRMLQIARERLTGAGVADTLAAAGFSFPLLVRSPGYHTGDHFVKVAGPHDLAHAIRPLPGAQLLVIEYIDTADANGDICKYRAIVVDGTLYPLHLAISRRWKVHYFSADMAESALHRRRDEAFISDMLATIGAPACAALDRIRDTLALDYGGIDFSLDGSGNVIVFEANASMIVPAPDADPRWNYRREPVMRIHAAVRRMLECRAILSPAARVAT